LLAAHGRSPNEDLDDAGVHDLLRDTQGLLHEEFVEAPYYYINWGKSADSFADQKAAGADQSCAEVLENLLGVPDKPRGWPSRYMARHQCIDEARYNSDMSPARFAAVVLVMLVAFVVSAAVGLAAFTLLLSKVMVAVLFVLLPGAAAAALLPGRARRLAWSWVGSLLQLWLVSLAMGIVVMLLLFALQSIRATTEAMTLAERWTTVLATVAVIYVGRGRMAVGTKRIGRTVAAGLGNLTESVRSQVWTTPWATRPALTGSSADTGGSGQGEPHPGAGHAGAHQESGGAHWPGGGGTGRDPAGSRSGQSTDASADAPSEGPAADDELDEDVVAKGAAAVGADALALGSGGLKLAGRAVSRSAEAVGWSARSPWRLYVQRHGENRRAFKAQVMRASMDDWSDMIKRGHAPGIKGVAGKIPSEAQVLQGTWKVRRGPAMRAVKRGQIDMYGGNHERLVKIRFGKPRRMMDADGKWHKIKPPPRRPVPGQVARAGRQNNVRIIRRARRRQRQGKSWP
jgi:hypothetical protein